ncbi:MAG TPA: DUF3054 domain-containing protein [Ktedonobacterales bacterium]|jgi:hypothetical protein|nr:DUF3054 domain-containing protein [Ktedonobacterales bacterium]
MQTRASGQPAQVAETSSPRNLPWWPWALVAGDLISFLIFTIAGRDTHRETAGLDAISQTLSTALPFVLGWFLVAPWLGAFRREKTRTPIAMLKRTELSWLCALPLVLALRWIFAGHIPPLSFAIVLALVNALLLGGWRTAFAWIVGRTRPQ